MLVRYLLLNFGYCLVSGVVESDFVALLGQGPDFGEGARLVIFTEAGGHSFLRDAIDDFCRAWDKRCSVSDVKVSQSALLKFVKLFLVLVGDKG